MIPDIGCKQYREEKSPSHFCDCLMCAKADVRLDIVVKGKNIFHVSVRINSADALLQFV
jgi:hypothetical protein